MAYATAADFREYYFLLADGSEDPEDLEFGLEEGARFLDRTLQIQAAYVIEAYDAVTAEDYKVPNILQVGYWAELAGWEEIDTSQNTLRPIEGYSRIGSISVPQFDVVAPQLIEELQRKGLWDPSGSFIRVGLDDG